LKESVRLFSFLNAEFTKLKNFGSFVYKEDPSALFYWPKANRFCHNKAIISSEVSIA
jgi:hypothetical protein